MSISRFQTVLDELAKSDIEAVALGGGEPTLHPQLREFLQAAQQSGLQTGLTTNGRDPEQVLALADAGLVDRFGVSAGKGAWEQLVSHRRAVTNLLLLRSEISQIVEWAVAAIKLGAQCLLLLAYKGDRPAFASPVGELGDAFGLLTAVGRRAGVSVAADTYTLRRLGLIDTCGEDFIRIDLEGEAAYCCFPSCDYWPTETKFLSRSSLA